MTRVPNWCLDETIDLHEKLNDAVIAVVVTFSRDGCISWREGFWLQHLDGRDS